MKLPSILPQPGVASFFVKIPCFQGGRHNTQERPLCPHCLDTCLDWCLYQISLRTWMGACKVLSATKKSIHYLQTTKGHLHKILVEYFSDLCLYPPSFLCFALNKMEFLNFFHKNVILIELLGKKYEALSQTKFLATPLVC